MDDKELTRADYDFESHIAQAIINAINKVDGLPHMQVRTENIQGYIPMKYDEEGQILFNVSMKAAPNLSICDGMVSMSVRFNGNDSLLAFPSADIISIYDKMTGIGMVVNAPSPDRPIVKNVRKQGSLAKAAEVSPKTIENVRRPLVRPGQLGTSQPAPTNDDAPAPEPKSNVIHRDFGNKNKKD